MTPKEEIAILERINEFMEESTLKGKQVRDYVNCINYLIAKKLALQSQAKSSEDGWISEEPAKPTEDKVVRK